MLAEFYDRTPPRYFSLRNFFHAHWNREERGRRILDGAEETGFFRVEGIRRVIPEYTEITPGCDDFLSGIEDPLPRSPFSPTDSIRFVTDHSSDGYLCVLSSSRTFVSSRAFLSFLFSSSSRKKSYPRGKSIDRARLEGYEKTISRIDKAEGGREVGLIFRFVRFISAAQKWLKNN